MLAKERRKVYDLTKSCFNNTASEDNNAIQDPFMHGQAFYIIGFSNNLHVHLVIAAVLYVMTEEGTYVNWLAVTKNIISVLCMVNMQHRNHLEEWVLVSFSYIWCKGKLLH